MLLFIAVLLNLCASILKTLKTCVDGGREAKQRETKPPLWLRTLKKEFGNKMIPYLLHASSCGSLSVIKYLLAIGQTPNIRYIYIHLLIAAYHDCLNHNYYTVHVTWGEAEEAPL